MNAQVAVSPEAARAPWPRTSNASKTLVAMKNHSAWLSKYAEAKRGKAVPLLA